MTTAYPTEQPARKPPQGGTRLITRPDEKQVLVGNQETDARGALTRGIKEYLEQIEWVAYGGRPIRLKRVTEDWAEPEDGAVDLPSAAVIPVGPGIYDGSKFNPTPSDKDRLPDGTYLMSPCELVQPLQADIYCGDPQQRMAVVAMLEQALLAPVTWMYGFRLALPHYFGLHAEYECTGITYVDSEQSAARRDRRAMVTFTARVPVCRVVAMPLAVVVPSLGALSDEQKAIMKERTKGAVLRLALDVEEQ